MKAYILNDKVHQVLYPYDIAYDFPDENWSPVPQAMLTFDEALTPYIKAQETQYDAETRWFESAYLLETVKEVKRPLFQITFKMLDERTARPMATVISAMTGDAPAPTADADIVWQLEEIKNENRRLLVKLEAATTWEEASAIVPWVPANF